MADIDKLIAVRLVVQSYERFERTVAFYGQLLQQDPYLRFGDPADPHAGAFFRVGDVDVVIAFETDVTPEASIDQGPAWLCFGTDAPDDLVRAHTVGLSDVVDTSFGTRASFVNDPAGFAVYVGSDWRHQGPP